MNIKTAFLHEEVDEIIYIKLSEGFSKEKSKVLRLLKALYRLK